MGNPTVIERGDYQVTLEWTIDATHGGKADAHRVLRAVIKARHQEFAAAAHEVLRVLPNGDEVRRAAIIKRLADEFGITALPAFPDGAAPEPAPTPAAIAEAERQAAERREQEEARAAQDAAEKKRAEEEAAAKDAERARLKEELRAELLAEQQGQAAPAAGADPALQAAQQPQN